MFISNAKSVGLHLSFMNIYHRSCCMIFIRTIFEAISRKPGCKTKIHDNNFSIALSYNYDLEVNHSLHNYHNISRKL